MTFLSPLGWLGLLGVPALLWLWRLAATRRMLPLSSLIPFERLMRRPPRRRTQLVTNLLFWLQLAAVVLIAAILARPVMWQARSRTVLVILDTSASMGARLAGRQTAWERAQGWLHGALSRKALAERWLLVTTAPVTALTAQPTAEVTALRAALAAARQTHAGGSLSTAWRVGQALLGGPPQEILVVTDEPAPPALPGHVRWQRVGPARADNVGLVGLDAQGTLCGETQAQALATVQNFGAEPVTIKLIASQQGRRLAEAIAPLPAGARQAVSLLLPADTQGVVELQLEPDDAFALDNQARLSMQPPAAWPIVVASEDPAFVETVGRWLAACPTLSWSVAPPAEGPYALITDRAAAAGGAGLLLFERPAAKAPRPSHWLAAGDHPIGAYLTRLGVVSAALSSGGEAASGTPVIWALSGSARAPVVVAREASGRRAVTYHLEPTTAAASTSVVLAFFNGLRWVLGAGHAGVLVGEPLAFEGFAPGPVEMRRPEGPAETIMSPGSVARYDATYWAGRYQARQGRHQAAGLVNFLNPVESQVAAPASTWQPIDAAVPAPEGPRVRAPLAGRLLLGLLALLLTEWLAYCFRQQRAAA